MKLYSIAVTILAIALGCYAGSEKIKHNRAQASADSMLLITLSVTLPTNLKIMETEILEPGEGITLIKETVMNQIEIFEDSIKEIKEKYPSADVGGFEIELLKWKSEIERLNQLVHDNPDSAPLHRDS